MTMLIICLGISLLAVGMVESGLKLRDQGLAAEAPQEIYYNITVAVRNLKIGAFPPTFLHYTLEMTDGNDVRTSQGDSDAVEGKANLDWKGKIIFLKYKFNEKQDIKITIYSGGSKAAGKRTTVFATGKCSLTDIASHPSQDLELELKKGTTAEKSGATVIIHAEKMPGAHLEVAEMKISADNLLGMNADQKKGGFFGVGKKKPTSDPFLVISYMEDNEENLQQVAQTEHYTNANSASWKPLKIPVFALNRGDNTKVIVFRVYDWDTNEHQLIGEYRTTLPQLIGLKAKQAFPLLNAEKATTGNISFEPVVVRDSQIEDCKSNTEIFRSYLVNGVGLDCIGGIDFTASNKSEHGNGVNLHEVVKSTGESQYTLAIKSLFPILEDYDSDHNFAVFWFGALFTATFKEIQEEFKSLPFTTEVQRQFNEKVAKATSHRYPLNGSEKPEVHETKGVLEAYNSAIQIVTFSGPTKFAPLIRYAIDRASSMDSPKYFILVIITDGIIVDKADTIDALYDAAGLPLSIVIVGVGTADFTDMNDLDGDNPDKPLLNSAGLKVPRDIVQFVDFKKFFKSPKNQFSVENLDGMKQEMNVLATRISRKRFSQEVLWEVPDQFVGYFESINLGLPRFLKYMAKIKADKENGSKISVSEALRNPDYLT